MTPERRKSPIKFKAKKVREWNPEEEPGEKTKAKICIPRIEWPKK